MVHALTVSQVSIARNHKKVLTDPCISINTQEVINRTKGEQTYRQRRDRCKQLTRKEVHHYGASY